MATNGQTGQARTRRRWLTLVAAGVFAVGVAGCSSTPIATAPQKADPLHGVLTPPGIPQPTGATKGTPTSYPNNQGGLAPIGTNPNLSSTNNATLASMSGGPLGRPLAMNDDGGPQGPRSQFGSGNPGPQAQTGYPAPNPNPKVEAVPDNAPGNPAPNGWQTQQPGDPTVQPVSMSRPPTNEDLTRQLQDRGMINQKIDQLSDGIHLTCYVSRGGNLRVLEVTAADYATSARSILQQIDGK